jgi:iron complex outermembrane recepter protein
MGREPARSDMLYGEDNASVPYDLRAVEPEKVVDAEAGVEVRRGRLLGRANAYAMEFDNEIALTGELSEIGLPVRTNVGRSHRRGIELELGWSPSDRWRLGATAAFSRNRLEQWTQVYDVYDAGGAWVETRPVTYEDVPPLLTPAVLLNGTVEWKPSADLHLFVAGRWVDAAQLDNTGNPGFRTPSFFNLDLQASLSLARWVKRGQPRVRVQATNLLNDARQWPGGYSYLSFTRDAGGAESLSGTAYYYPLATRSVYVTLDVRF